MGVVGVVRINDSSGELCFSRTNQGEAIIYFHSPRYHVITARVTAIMPNNLDRGST